MKIINITGTIFNFIVEEIRNELEEIGGEDIRVEINSPGGSVFAAFELFNLFKNYSGNVNTHIVGLAASAASYVFLAGDERTAEENSVYFIHNAQNFSSGDQNDLRKMADLLENLSNILAKEYSRKTGVPLNEIKDLMNEETFFFGNEIKKFGVADQIIKGKNKKDQETNRADALLMAEMEVEECLNKMKKMENDESETEKIAAFLNLNNKKIENNSTEIKSKKNSNPNPASAGKNKQEAAMNLQEFLAANPATKMEFDNALKEQFKAGFDEGKEKIEARIKNASKYLGSEYPDSVKKIATEAITGVKSIETLEAVVAVYDMNNEQKNSENAQDESKAAGDIPTGQIPKASEDGTIKNEVDYIANVAADRKEAGLEVS